MTRTATTRTAGALFGHRRRRHHPIRVAIGAVRRRAKRLDRVLGIGPSPSLSRSPAEGADRRRRGDRGARGFYRRRLDAGQTGAVLRGRRAAPGRGAAPEPSGDSVVDRLRGRTRSSCWDKPAGMVVASGRRQRGRDPGQRAAGALRAAGCHGIGGVARPWYRPPARQGHQRGLNGRRQRPTPRMRGLTAQFRRGMPWARTYVAVVRGVPVRPAATIERAGRPQPPRNRERRWRLVAGGRRAVTHYVVDPASLAGGRGLRRHLPAGDRADPSDPRAHDA